MKPLVSFREIRESTPFPPVHDHGTVRFSYLEEWLKVWGLGETREDRLQMEIDPDFQRPHVWTRAQQAAYVSYLLQGGPSGRELYWGCDTLEALGGGDGVVQLVDGKQRLEAIRRFMRDDLKVFGQTLSQFPDNLRVANMARVEMCIAMADRAQILRWYLALNGGGTPHTLADLNRVRRLLRKAECDQGCSGK